MSDQLPDHPDIIDYHLEQIKKHMDSNEFIMLHFYPDGGTDGAIKILSNMSVERMAQCMELLGEVDFSDPTVDKKIGEG